MSSALERWRALVLARRAQMDAAYARLGGTSAGYWEQRAERFRAIGLELPTDDAGLSLARRLTTAASTVLDVGAGAGRYARALAPHVQEIVAVEPNGVLLEHLRADAAAAGLTNVHPVQSPWEDAAVAPADLVFCAHVLYPLADVEGFIRKLDAHARGACLLLAMADSQREPPLLLELWQHFHGDQRIGQPDARHLYDVLYELGIAPNVEMAPLPLTAAMWRFDSLDEAVAVCREHLILAPDPATDRALADALSHALAPLPGGGWEQPNPPRLVAGLWWPAEGPRLVAVQG